MVIYVYCMARDKHVCTVLAAYMYVHFFFPFGNSLSQDKMMQQCKCVIRKLGGLQHVDLGE